MNVDYSAYEDGVYNISWKDINCSIDVVMSMFNNKLLWPDLPLDTYTLNFSDVTFSVLLNLTIDEDDIHWSIDSKGEMLYNYSKLNMSSKNPTSQK